VSGTTCGQCGAPCRNENELTAHVLSAHNVTLQDGIREIQERTVAPEDDD
jgi:hypothetical protein